jgi:hypothetical protein
LEPTARVSRNGDQTGQFQAGLDCLKELYTVAIEAIGDDVPEWQSTFLVERLDHRSGQLRLWLITQVFGYLAAGSTDGISFAKPLLRQKELFIY